MAHAVSTVHVHPVIDDGIDQGVSRLAILAFLRTSHGIEGESKVYRGHLVRRIFSMDGTFFTLLHRDADGTTRHATTHKSRTLDDVSAAGALDMFDAIIDAVRAEYPEDYLTPEQRADDDAVARIMEVIESLDGMHYAPDGVILQVSGGYQLRLDDLRRVASAVR